MSNEEIVKEIDEATNLMTEAKVKTNVALNLARNAVMKESKADEEAYNKGLEDAWELARKLVRRSNDENAIIFDGHCYLEDLFDNFTPQEALAKLEAYEKSKEIKVGDIVKDGKNYFLVTKRYNNTFEGMSDEGYLHCGLSLRDCEKTSKHIDLTDIFKQIGSDADELS